MFSWGDAANSGAASTLQFTPTAISAPLNTPFKLGTLTFFNGSNTNDPDQVDFDISVNLTNAPATETLTLDTPLTLVNTPNTSDPVASADTVALGQFGYTFHVEEGQTASVDVYAMLGSNGSLTAAGTSPNSVTITDLRNPTAGGFVSTLNIQGTKAGQTVSSGGTIAPFSGVTVVDSTPGLSQTLTVSLSAAANGTLSNLGGGSYDPTTGLYTVTGTTATVDAAVQGLVFTPSSGSSATTTFTVTDTDSDGASATDTATSVTATGGATPPPGGGGSSPSPSPPPQSPVTPNFTVADLTTGQTSVTAGTPLPGGSTLFADITTDSLNIAANVPNAFIQSGSGNDILSATAGGNNVLDDTGGQVNFEFGSNGTGTDTFFLDTRHDPVSWNTIANFHSGDAAIIYGVTPQDLTTFAANGLGVPNYQGLTLRTFQSGGAAYLTLAGYSTADLSNGRLLTAVGTAPDGSSFLLVQAH